jgi:hypothetical protein
MRFVDRAQIATPASLTSANPAWSQEIADARNYYSGVRPEKSFPFKVYKSIEVKHALNQLFHGKCAYCESLFEATQPLDVEHFRPKGGIEESPGHPGYWWLAMRWENLLPSCIDCNRRREQVVVRLGMPLSEVERLIKARDSIPAGKKNSFPTKNNYWCAPEGDVVALEQPLLVDPTRVDPRMFIRWDMSGDLPIAVPNADADHNTSSEGAASIALFALNRVGLAQARRKTLLNLLAAAQVINDAIEAIGEIPGHEQHQLERVLKLASRLEEFACPDRPYSELARVFIDQFRSDLMARVAPGVARSRPAARELEET